MHALETIMTDGLCMAQRNRQTPTQKQTLSSGDETALVRGSIHQCLAVGSPHRKPSVLCSESPAAVVTSAETLATLLVVCLPLSCAGNQDDRYDLQHAASQHLCVAKRCSHVRLQTQANFASM